MTEPDASGAIYHPAPDEAQLTPKAVIMGCLIGGIVGAMNVYIGLKIGWTFGASITAAVLGYAFFKAIGANYTVLETNITQTTGSAAGAMASAAGLVAAIPAMSMLGYKLTLPELFMWSLAVSGLGVCFAVPLRKQFVVRENLRFPTGTATGETVVTLFQGSEAGDKARALIIWALVGGAYSLAAYFVPFIEHPEVHSGLLGMIGAWSFSVYVSPALMGAGLLVGTRISGSLMLGAILAWGVAAPFVVDAGWAAGPAQGEDGLWGYGGLMSYASGARGWLLWPGVAIMIADALTTLGIAIVTIFRNMNKREGAQTQEVIDHPDQIPTWWWVAGLGVASVMTTAIASTVFDIPVLFCLIAIALSWVLAIIAVRSTGETDINPVGGVGKVMQLVFGGLAPGSIPTNLMSAAISGAGASQAADMMQDFKTGRMVGASPRKQFISQLIGIPFGAVIVVPVYALFDSAYTIGEGGIPAPAAHAWRAMAELLAKGLTALPQNALPAVLVGLIIGALLPILKTLLGPEKSGWLPSGLAMGIAFIIPAYYSVCIALGTVGWLIWKRFDKVGAVALAFSVASGLLVGDGLMGIAKAAMTLFEVPTLSGG